MQNHNFSARPNFLRRGPGILDWLNKLFFNAANNNGHAPDLPYKIEEANANPDVPPARDFRLVE
jgi:hypothetical protein